jgi:hypothetical protein
MITDTHPEGICPPLPCGVQILVGEIYAGVGPAMRTPYVDVRTHAALSQLIARHRCGLVAGGLCL